MTSFVCILEKIPEDVVILIGEFLPVTTLLWLNKKCYIENHKKIRKMIPPKLYDNYIRDMVRKENAFILSFIAKENIQRWMIKKKVVYKNISYANYAAFLSDYCVQHNSTNCRNVLSKETGLSKNQHKNNRKLNIRWKF